MGINELTGSPWHVEQMRRGDEDPRRDRRRCKYYTGTQCKYRYGKCIGSAHCQFYEERTQLKNTEESCPSLSQLDENHLQQETPPIDDSELLNYFQQALIPPKKRATEKVTPANKKKSSKKLKSKKSADCEHHPPKRISKEERDAWVREYNQLSDYQKKQLAKKNHKKKK